MIMKNLMTLLFVVAFGAMSFAQTSTTATMKAVNQKEVAQQTAEAKTITPLKEGVTQATVTADKVIPTTPSVERSKEALSKTAAKPACTAAQKKSCAKTCSAKKKSSTAANVVPAKTTAAKTE